MWNHTMICFSLWWNTFVKFINVDVCSCGSLIFAIYLPSLLLMHFWIVSIFAITNPAAGNSLILSSWGPGARLPLGKTPRRGTVGHRVCPSTAWLDNARFSTVVVPTHTPPNNVWEMSLLHVLTNTCCLLTIVVASWVRVRTEIWGFNVYVPAY